MAEESGSAKLPAGKPSEELTGHPKPTGEPAPNARGEAEAPVTSDRPGQFEEASGLPFLVVGIGASAGGLEAFIELFDGLAPDTGMAFVVIFHMMADQESHLGETISRHTPMPVAEIGKGIVPEPNHVYILPPGVRASLKGGAFHLDSRIADGAPSAIDHFFRSLAAEQRNRAVGVVLSGTDADGALGLKAIKGEGGFAIVQSPDSARFAEIPVSSISHDYVDRILPPGQIASELQQIGRQFYQPVLRTLEEGTQPIDDEVHFAGILNLLRGVSGIDFRLYKAATLYRRIARRMVLHHTGTLAEYAGFLQGNAIEVRDLQEDLLINVTRFFRDPGVFSALKETVLPSIFEGRAPEQQVRIWVAGCSSGEEVYSTAICLLEYLTGQSPEPPIQIFGTDASDHSIQKARAGIFPESLVGEISPERLRRFFVKIDEGYQVSKRVRDLCIFARQNLGHDPPFSKMDLISCRNVLIYLGAELQKQILSTFHYALQPNGFLMLGTSETIHELTGLFQLIDRRHKFFSRIASSSSRAMTAGSSHVFFADSAVQPLPSLGPENWGDLELQRAADRLVLARYGPPGVVVNENLEILQSRGHTSPFMEMPQGSVSLQLTRMLRETIGTTVSEAVRQAVEQDQPVRVEGLHVPENGHTREVTLEVLPIHSSAPRTRCFLVLFAPRRPVAEDLPQEGAGAPQEAVRDKEQLVERLRQELSSTKLYLQSVLEERDVRNQELSSANEEIQSSNEELETTKEELQSSNEELQTINDELQQRNATLTQTTNDLSNLLNNVNLPVLMLSNELHIRHFTPPAERLMNLRGPDIGRPFSEIRVNLKTDDLAPLFREVLETLAPREIEVQDREGRWHLLRMRPYRTSDNKIEGVVVVLVDIDQLRTSQQQLRVARDFARSVIQSVPLPLVVVDFDFRILAANDAFRTLAGTGDQDIVNRSLIDLTGAAWGLEQPLRTRLQELRAALDHEKGFDFEHKTPGENPKIFDVRGRVLKPDGEMYLLVTIQNITAHKEAERLLAAEGERLATEVASRARELGRTRDELRALTASLFTSHEDERRRVARELHDGVNQRLAMLEIEVQQLKGSCGKEATGMQEALEGLRTRIADLSDEVRRISRALHPSVIEDLGLQPAVQTLVEQFGGKENMIVEFRAHRIPETIPVEIATGLYRITQEALRNVALHAGKTHVKVSLHGGPGRIRLQVADSGAGFDVRAHRSGLGLIGMEERTRIMQGTLKIESEPGEGTRISVDVPLP